MSFHLSKYLEYKLSEVLRQKFSELYFDSGLYCPQVGDLPEGSNYITVEMVRHYGQAAVASGRVQDVPVTEVTVGEEVYKTVYIIGQAQYSDTELKAATYAERNGQIVTNLKDERLVALRRMIDVKSNELCAFGSSQLGLHGILNHPEVPVSASSSYRIYAANADPKQILDFINSEIETMYSQTELTEYPNTMLISTKLYSILKGTYRNSNTDTTLLQSILDTNPYLRTIAPIRELSSAKLLEAGVHAPGTAKDRMMFYNLDPKNVKRHFNNLYLMPPQTSGFNHQVIGYKGVSSVRVSYPLSFRYVDYPIATTNN